MKWKTQNHFCPDPRRGFAGVLRGFVRSGPADGTGQRTAREQRGGAGNLAGSGKTGKRKLRQRRNAGRRALAEEEEGEESHGRSISTKGYGYAGWEAVLEDLWSPPQEEPYVPPTVILATDLHYQSHQADDGGQAFRTFRRIPATARWWSTCRSFWRRFWTRS